MLKYVVFLLSVTTICFAENFDRAYKDWSVYSYTEGGRKICYAVTYAKESSGTFSKRSEPYLMVAHTGKAVGEVSTSSGYPYKENKINISIDGKFKHNFITLDEVAWAKNSHEDEEIIGKMKKGIKLTVDGISTKDTTSRDVYSLLGFSNAYDRLSQLCKK